MKLIKSEAYKMMHKWKGPWKKGYWNESYTLDFICASEEAYDGILELSLKTGKKFYDPSLKLMVGEIQLPAATSMDQVMEWVNHPYSDTIPGDYVLPKDLTKKILKADKIFEKSLNSKEKKYALKGSPYYYGEYIYIVYGKPVLGSSIQKICKKYGKDSWKDHLKDHDWQKELDKMQNKQD